MSQLDLDKGEQMMFEDGANGYGVEVYGGTPDEREAALKEYLDEPFTVVQGGEIDAEEDLFKSVLSDGDTSGPISSFAAEKYLRGKGGSLLILGFDQIPSDVQTDVAQYTKGFAEDRNFDCQIGFSSEEGGVVVHAEGDLRGRVRSWNIEEYMMSN